MGSMFAENLPGGRNALLEVARRSAQKGELHGAHQAYARLLALDPSDLEALNFLAMFALGSGHLDEALSLLDRAIAIDADDQPTLKNLGVTLLRSGDNAKAEHVLRQAVLHNPGFFVARLYLGLALERQGRQQRALSHYLKALSTAQLHGEWLNPATTPAGLRPSVEHAARFVRAGRRQLLASVLDPLRERYGRDSMSRVEKCMANYMGEIICVPEHPQQRPTFLYFPGLPESPFLPRSRFSWMDELEAKTSIVRDELRRIDELDERLEPFLEKPPPGAHSSYLAGNAAEAAPRWDAMFFYRHGVRYEHNHQRCPSTVAALELTSIVHIPKHAPEALFSVLGPGSHILPHHGVTNTRVVAHLPLIVPSDCSLRVADQHHAWREGECIVFDDTFEHEAWNNSQSTRVILLFDVWNPSLTEAERAAITDLVVAIGETNADDTL